MGFIEEIKDQFRDVIEYQDINSKLIVVKFFRESGNNELKQGSKVIVREGQSVVFLKGGQLADILPPGTYSLKTDNMPILSTLGAFPYWFTSPVISDVYFVSTKQFIDNKWATKNPIMKRDNIFNLVRIGACGKFAFRIVDFYTFMKEIFGTRGIVVTNDIVEYLSSMVTEGFSVTVGESSKPVIDLAAEYRNLAKDIQRRLNEQAKKIGVEFSDVLIENIMLPQNVEKMLDEQSGIGMATLDMDKFLKYQAVQAMRDASKQGSGLAGIGAELALGKVMADNISGITTPTPQRKNKIEQLYDLKRLLDEGLLTKEEFEREKKLILESNA